MAGEIAKAIGVGLIVIMSAGNGGLTLTTPAQAICVGACVGPDASPTIHPTSNRGDTVNCWSWGDGVWAGTTLNGVSTVGATFSSTSAAVAIVAGIAAGAQSVRKALGKPLLKHHQIKSLLCDPNNAYRMVSGGAMPDAGKVAKAAQALP